MLVETTYVRIGDDAEVVSHNMKNFASRRLLICRIKNGNAPADST